jgi:hypothetical protein
MIQLDLITFWSPGFFTGRKVFVVALILGIIHGVEQIFDIVKGEAATANVFERTDVGNRFLGGRTTEQENAQETKKEKTGHGIGYLAAKIGEYRGWLKQKAPATQNE